MLNYMFWIFSFEVEDSSVFALFGVHYFCAVYFAFRWRSGTFFTDQSGSLCRVLRIFGLPFNFLSSDSVGLSHGRSLLILRSWAGIKSFKVTGIWALSCSPEIWAFSSSLIFGFFRIELLEFNSAPQLPCRALYSPVHPLGLGKEASIDPEFLL